LDVNDKRNFICRYKRTDKNALIRLTERQADEGRTRMEDSKIRNMFVHHTRNPPPREPGTRYRLGDAFCGVGGASAGARKAGLDPIWSFDIDKPTSEIYSLNFPETTVWAASVDQFLSLDRVEQVDVLHMSPPCQFFSAAHTVPGENDEANSSAILSIDRLLEKVHPRIATLEQVPGLAQIADNK